MTDAERDELLGMAVSLEDRSRELIAIAKRLRERAAAATTAAEPQWLIWAREEVGVTEIRGKASLKRIEWYHSHTAAGAALDEVPWCSSFMCAAFAAQGIRTTRSKAAVSWMNWGERVETSDVKVGDVLIFKRKGGHHVAFYTGESPHEYLCLGGNQSDSVCVKPYAKRDLLGVRRPA